VRKLAITRTRPGEAERPYVEVRRLSYCDRKDIFFCTFVLSSSVRLSFLIIFLRSLQNINIVLLLLLLLMSSSSDEERYWRRRRERLTEEQQKQKRRQRRGWVGSKPGKAPNFDRERVKFHYQLMKDYFDPNPTYNAHLFRRRFRMRRELFERIKEEMLRNHYDHFRTKVNPVDGLTGFTVEQKMTAALRVLAYGGAADQQDEYVRMGEETVRQYLGHFCNAIISSFSSFYLRSPTADDLEYILSLHSSQGFPGRLGSIDVMHWEWKNCPTSWAGQYKLGWLLFYVLKAVVVFLFF